MDALNIIALVFLGGASVLLIGDVLNIFTPRHIDERPYSLRENINFGVIVVGLVVSVLAGIVLVITGLIQQDWLHWLALLVVAAVAVAIIVVTHKTVLWLQTLSQRSRQPVRAR